MVLKRFLSIFSDLIFDSRVDPGIPSLAAAPDWPDTRPRHSRSAASMIAFSVSAGLLESSYAAAVRWAAGKAAFVHGESLRITDNDGALDNILQFANIAGPGIRLKKGKTLTVNSLKSLAGLPGIAIKKVLHQQRNVFASFPERGHLNREDAKPVKQVTPKLACGDGSLEVAVGSGEYADICLDGSASANTLKFAFLKNARQSDLSFGRKISDFIEEKACHPQPVRIGRRAAEPLL